MKHTLSVSAKSLSIALALAASLGGATERRSVLVGGELLHEGKALDFLTAIARNLSRRPGFRARAIYHEAILRSSGEAAYRKAVRAGALIVEQPLRLPWLEPNGMKRVAEGSAVAWITMSLYGTAIELVAFVVDERGRLIGIPHRQASTRVIPGYGGRFDRVAPGPRQYLRNATVELAADIAAVLGRNLPLKTPEFIPLFFPTKLSEKNRAWLESFFALFAKFAVERAGMMPCLSDGERSLPRFELEYSGGTVESPDELVLTIYLVRSEKERILYYSGQSAMSSILHLARSAVSQLFNGGERILLTLPPQDEEKTAAKNGEENEPVFSLPSPPPPSPIRLLGDRILWGGDRKRAPRWEFLASDTVGSKPVVRQNRVAFGCRNGELFVVSAESGEELLRRELPDSVCLAALTASGLLVASDISGNLLLATFEGKRLRTLARREEPRPARFVCDLPGERIGVMFCDGALAIFDRLNGKELRRLPLPERIVQPPALYGDAILAIGVSGQIYRVVGGDVAPLVWLPYPAVEPPVVHLAIKLPIAAFEEQEIDVLSVRDTSGGTVIVSLNDARRPADPLDLSLEDEGGMEEIE